jgi:glycosyltransferase involved in cell wall biosynthesis
VYQDYLAHSLAEFSVAKHAYVASRCGWFSDRSAGYLALGVPVIVQDTGFAEVIGADAGLLTFSSPDEARGAIESLLADPARHNEAALAIAAAHFDARRVLTRLLEEAMCDG